MADGSSWDSNTITSSPLPLLESMCAPFLLLKEKGGGTFRCRRP
jgi:hypothetical protein